MIDNGGSLHDLTLMIEVLGAIPRFFFGLFVATIFVPFGLFLLALPWWYITKDTDGIFRIWMITSTGLIILLAATLALLPLVMSVLTFSVLPGGFLVTRFALGARELSRREQLALDGALHDIRSYDPGRIPAPTRFFVIDQPSPNAFLIGTTLYLHRELLHNSPHLAAVVAHELGHLQLDDGRLTLALRRLVIAPLYLLSRTIGQLAPGTISLASVGKNPSGCLIGGLIWLLSLLLSIAGGGFGLWLLNPLWVRYWRQREYLADGLAASWGQGPALREFLEEHQFFDVSTPYFMNDHPATELRIDRLELFEEEPEVRDPMPPASSAQQQQDDAVSARQRTSRETVLTWGNANLKALALRGKQGYEERGRGVVWVDWDAESPTQVLDYRDLNWMVLATRVVEAKDVENGELTRNLQECIETIKVYDPATAYVIGFWFVGSDGYLQFIHHHLKLVVLDRPD